MKTTEKIYYKLVTKLKDGTLHPLVYNQDDIYLKYFDIEYKINEYIKPKIGHLFVFLTKENAINYMTNIRPYTQQLRLYKAIGINQHKLSVFNLFSWSLNFLSWNNKKKKKKYKQYGSDNYVHGAPNGSVCVEQLKLLEQIM